MAGPSSTVRGWIFDRFWVSRGARFGFKPTDEYRAHPAVDEARNRGPIDIISTWATPLVARSDPSRVASPWRLLPETTSPRTSRVKLTVARNSPKISDRRNRFRARRLSRPTIRFINRRFFGTVNDRRVTSHCSPFDSRTRGGELRSNVREGRVIRASKG